MHTLFTEELAADFRNHHRTTARDRQQSQDLLKVTNALSQALGRPEEESKTMPPDHSRRALISVIDDLLAIAEENRTGPPLEPEKLADVRKLDARLYALCQQTQLVLPAYAEPDYGEILSGSRLVYYMQGPVPGGDGVVNQGGIRFAAIPEWRQTMHCLREAATMQPAVLGQPGEGTGPSGTPAPPAARSAEPTPLRAQADGAGAVNGAADSADAETDAEELTSRQVLILETMSQHEITSERRRERRRAIEQLVNRTYTPQTCNRDFALLKKRGLLQSREGPRGGVWLTSKGTAEAERLRSSE